MRAQRKPLGRSPGAAGRRSARQRRPRPLLGALRRGSQRLLRSAPLRAPSQPQGTSCGPRAAQIPAPAALGSPHTVAHPALGSSPPRTIIAMAAKRCAPPPSLRALRALAVRRPEEPPPSSAKCRPAGRARPTAGVQMPGSRGLR